MYLHLGSDVMIHSMDMVAMFDLDNTTSSRDTREFLRAAQQNGEVVNIGEEIPKSFVVSCYAGKTTVYLSPISTKTLQKRLMFYLQP